MDYKEINSHAKACKILKKDPKASSRTDDQLVDIANAINKVTKHNPKKTAGYRPYFWHDRQKGTFGFSHSGHGRWDAITFAGARLCFEFQDGETSDYFAKEFLSMHKKQFFQK